MTSDTKNRLAFLVAMTVFVAIVYPALYLPRLIQFIEKYRYDGVVNDWLVIGLVVFCLGPLSGLFLSFYTYHWWKKNR